MNEKNLSNGYEANAQAYIGKRSQSIGVESVRSWARALVPKATILDLGCGNGIPITKALAKDGYLLYGIDASPTLIASYHEHFPDHAVACEPVETTDFFGRKFDGVIAWGLLFLLSKSAQSELIHRVSTILNQGGQFLFTSPKQICTWTDILTGLESRSLGAERYKRILTSAGLSLIGNDTTDEGNNYYYIVEKQ